MQQPIITQSVSSSNYLQKRATFAAAITLITASALLLGHDFQQNAQKAYAIQNDLSHYQLYIQQSHPGSDRLMRALPLLEALRQTAENKTGSLSIFSNLLSFYSKKSQQTANLVYQQALHTIVIPEVKTFFEKYLQTANEKNPEYVYRALKAYLMLNDLKSLQPLFIANTLNQMLPKAMSQEAVSELAEHIQTALNSPTELNNELIQQVRKQLANISPVDTAMLILKNTDDNNADSAISLGTNLGVPLFLLAIKLLIVSPTCLLRINSSLLSIMKFLLLQWKH